MNLPNIITFFRLIIAPFIVWSLFRGDDIGIAIALLLFFLACISDTLDGAVARSLGLVSKFGAVLDHTADKLLIIVTLITMMILGYIKGVHIIPVFIIVIRDLLLAGLREISASNQMNIFPDFIGKTKTVVQMSAIIVILISMTFPMLYGLGLYLIGIIMLWIASVLSLISLLNYAAYFCAHGGRGRN